MLSDPNDESPANIDAAVMWREKYDDFKKKVYQCVAKVLRIKLFFYLNK